MGETLAFGDALDRLRCCEPWLDAVLLDGSRDGWTDAATMLDRGGPIECLFGPSGEWSSPDERLVAASLLFHGYAVRVLGTAVAMWLLTGAVPDVGSDNTAIAWQGALPARLGLRRARTGEDAGFRGEEASLRWLNERAFGSHLDPLAAALTEVVAIAPQVLWGNAAMAVVGAGHAVERSALPAERPRIARAVVRILDAMPHHLAGLIRRHGVAGHSFWVRTTCCLAYRTDPRAAVCNTCARLTADETLRRHLATCGAS